jgi:DNA-directed RNA polymerase specialized sigma24 family protein
VLRWIAFTALRKIFDDRAHKIGAAVPDAAEDLFALRSLLVDRYGDHKSRLARRLGPTDWAEEALQDTYLKLDSSVTTG